MTEDFYFQVFIKNIPYEINDNDLAEWCSTFGPVAMCEIKRDHAGNSRGFAFVTFAYVEGYNNILSRGPHSCRGRPLLIKSANSDENPSNSFSSYPLSPSTVGGSINENLNSTTNENSYGYDVDSSDRLAAVRDELEANLECMQIAHDHELKVLRDKIAREKKLLKQAEELYHESEEDWQKINEDNLRLRASLSKNVMQTFNIRRDLARRTKDQLRKCEQLERQYTDVNQS